MENLQQATEKICELKGNVLALETFITALIQVLPHDALQPLANVFGKQAEDLQTLLLNAKISEHSVDAAVHATQRLSAMLKHRLGL
jgi:hypothetical protein